MPTNDRTRIGSSCELFYNRQPTDWSRFPTAGVWGAGSPWAFDRSHRNFQVFARERDGDLAGFKASRQKRERESKKWKDLGHSFCWPLSLLRALRDVEFVKYIDYYCYCYYYNNYYHYYYYNIIDVGRSVPSVVTILGSTWIYKGYFPCKPLVPSCFSGNVDSIM